MCLTCSDTNVSIESEMQHVTPYTKRDTPPTSASKSKLSEQYKELEELEINIDNNVNLGYVILDLNQFLVILYVAIFVVDK